MKLLTALLWVLLPINTYAAVSAPTNLTTTSAYANNSITLNWDNNSSHQQWYIYFGGSMMASPSRLQVSYIGSTKIAYTLQTPVIPQLPASLYITAIQSGVQSGPSNTLTITSVSGGGQVVSVTGTVSVAVKSGMESVTITSMPPLSVAFPDSYTGVSVKAGLDSVTITSMPAISFPSSYLGVSVFSGVAGLSVTASQGSPWTVSGSVGVTSLPIIGTVGNVSLTAGTATIGSVGVTNQVSVGITHTVDVHGSVDLSSIPFYIGVTQAAIVFYNSVSNNSSAQLGAGATFTGAIEVAFNQPAMQVMVVCDQNYTVYVDQFDGANNLVSTDTFTRTAGNPTNENIMVNGDGARVRVTNNGGSATTTLRIETTYGPLPPQARAVTSLGNNKTALMEVNGTATSVGGGVVDNGTLRVALAGGTVTSGTIAANGATITVNANSGAGGYAFQISTGFTGTIVTDISLDGGTTWTQVPFFYGNAAAYTQVASQANPATGSLVIPQINGGTQCRLRASAYTSGTLAAKGSALSGSVSSPWLATQPASQSGTWTVQPGNTANTTSWLVSQTMLGAQANSISSPAFSSGAFYAGVLKTSGAILSNISVMSLTTTAGIPVVVHLYNQTGTPVVGQVANHFARFAAVGPGVGNYEFGTNGVTMTVGLAYTVTGGIADADATSLTAAAAMNIIYK